jgi:hypothetical protein
MRVDGIEQLIYDNFVKVPRAWYVLTPSSSRYKKDPSVLLLHNKDLNVTINTGNRLYGGGYIEYDVYAAGHTTVRGDSFRFKLKRSWARKFRRHWLKFRSTSAPVIRERLEVDLLAEKLQRYFIPANAIFGSKRTK